MYCNVVWLRSLLRATTTYTFGPKMVQTPSALDILTSKCASRHNGVHFFDTFSTSQRQKVVREWCVLYILTWKCASRHNGVHFFDITTSKSGPSMVCFVHFDLEMCFAPQRRALFQHLNFQKWSEHGVFCTFWLPNVLRATTACTFSTSQLPKVVRSWCVLYILTWKCASRHNGVHFFNISTSKSGPKLVCFVHFDLEMCFAPQRRALFNISISKSGPKLVCFVHFDFQMCFAPQRRALFRHLNFQKWSDNGVFCTFWLPNVLRATTACNFSSLIWPAGSAPAALASLLFDPPEPQIIGKTQCFATFLPFRASPSFSSDSSSSTLLSSTLSLLSASSLLCFSSVHIVGSLTSKLPSSNQIKCIQMQLLYANWANLRFFHFPSAPNISKLFHFSQISARFQRCHEMSIVPVMCSFAQATKLPSTDLVASAHKQHRSAGYRRYSHKMS